jgi:heme exporter protein D
MALEMTLAALALEQTESLQKRQALLQKKTAGSKSGRLI